MIDSKSKTRIMVVTIPKAGTYLTFELLKKMGLRETSLHIQHDDRATGLFDFRNAPKQLLHEEQARYFQPLPLDQALERIKPGEFAVGHLPPFPEVKKLLRQSNNFKTIFLVRNLRDCLISHMRYMIKIGAITAQRYPWCNLIDGRERFRQYLTDYAETIGPLVHMKLIASWEYDIRMPYTGMDLLKVRFEDLVSKDRAIVASTIGSIAEFLDIEAPIDPHTLINSSLDTPTLTKSDGISSRAEYWSDFAEQWFQEHIRDEQGNDLNKMMGYDD